MKVHLKVVRKNLMTMYKILYVHKYVDLKLAFGKYYHCFLITYMLFSLIELSR